MAGERPSDAANNDEELRKRKRLGEVLRAAQPDQEQDKTARALDIGKVAAEVGGETKKRKKKRPEAETEEPEAPVELTPDEQTEVGRQIIAARKEAVAGEREAADPAEIAEIDADTAYLEAVDARVQAGELPQDAVESAYAAEAGLSDEPLFEGEFGEGGLGEGEVPLHTVESAPDSDQLLDMETAEQPSPAAEWSGSVPENTTGAAHAVSAAEMLSSAAANAKGEVYAVGGIIAALAGALVANRLGGQKTGPERRARDLQRSFERQIAQIHEQVTVHEEQIRRLTRERTEATTQVREVVTPVPAAAERVAAKTPQPEVVRANAPVPDVERMSLQDVLDISEKIYVDNKTVRQIYAENRISQRGLRRIAAEYLNGGNVRRVLKQELLIKAIAMELDPVLRDRVPESESVAAHRQAEDAAPESRSQTQQPNAQLPVGTAAPTAASSTPPQRVSTPLLIIANIIALVILGVLLLILFTILIIR